MVADAQWYNKLDSYRTVLKVQYTWLQIHKGVTRTRTLLNTIHFFLSITRDGKHDAPMIHQKSGCTYSGHWLSPILGDATLSHVSVTHRYAPGIPHPWMLSLTCKNSNTEQLNFRWIYTGPLMPQVILRWDLQRTSCAFIVCSRSIVFCNPTFLLGPSLCLVPLSVYSPHTRATTLSSWSVVFFNPTQIYLSPTSSSLLEQVSSRDKACPRLSSTWDTSRN